MHFSIPDTAEVTEGGATFTVFNLHINGAYHCSVRYRLFHSFHEQLKKEFGVASLPSFPPKKLLSLSPSQLEERRALLERYIQVLSQNTQIAGSDTFNSFLLQAQQESQKEEPEPVRLHVYLVNGHKINVGITSTDQTDAVLEAVAADIDLPDDFVYYFGLYLVRMEQDDEHSIVRKLQEFESPYISLKAACQTDEHRIILRKSYWDPMHDDDLIADRVAMNLLYVQAVNDVERSWVLATKDEHKQLCSLQQKGSKKEYLRFARTLKYYGYIQFPPCLVDYPTDGCRAIVSAGNKELNFRIEVEQDVLKEVSFKVTRMRCWRITTTQIPDGMNGVGSNGHEHAQLELAFEYLIAKDTMQWITVFSDQAIVISMCLQGMVDELVMKKEGRKFKKPADRQRRSSATTGVKKELPSPQRNSLSLPSPASEDFLPTRIVGGRAAVPKAAQSENHVFEGIGDDDL